MKFTNRFKGHQGDVQIYSIESLPTGAKAVKNNLIAKSERSGHCHVLCGDYEMFEVEGKEGFYVNVKGELAVMNHTRFDTLTEQTMASPTETPIADHKPTIVPKGLYYVGIQRRVNPFKKVWEQVKD